MRDNKRILIFNVNWLGDVLFSTAVIRNIRYNYPDSFIACAVPKRCRSILEGNPYLNEIIIFDEKDSHKGLFAQLSFIKMLKSKKFDMVFLLHRSFTRALVARLAGIPERFGYYTKKRGFLLTKKIIAPDRDSLHRADYYLNVIEQSGLKVKDKFADFVFSDTDAKSVEDWLSHHGIASQDFLAVLNPGGNWLPKRWPKENWVHLAEGLAKNFGAKIVITGAQTDVALARSIREAVKEKPVVACGVFSLKQLGSLAKRADVFITADSGPLHIANAVGAKKIIALFGPTSTMITGPLPQSNTVILQKDVGCPIPCYKVKCQDNRCMKAITPEDVIKEIRLK
ncbi:MAG: lipopolysaccharide heptosyltransferase II [Candidatus Omnitrophica bacterium]|nr:lipopolysaccharide heptosyltransferase II [Candidatus Omnitrophota bacterium]MBU1869988.1 lipopolysaccharide heptosyltransferase II [Candidatus Omnitrophota bacterium]